MVAKSTVKNQADLGENMFPVTCVLFDLRQRISPRTSVSHLYNGDINGTSKRGYCEIK